MGIFQRDTLNLTIKELSFYLFFGLLFFAKGIGLYDGQNSFKIFLLLAACFYLVKMLLTSYTLAEIVTIGTLYLCAGIIYWNTKEKGILFTVMIVTGMKDIPLKRAIGSALAVWCLAYLPTVVLTTLGLVDSPFRVHVRPIVGFVVRWGLGMAHPNVGHISYLILAALIVAFQKEKIRWMTIILLFFGNLFVYFYTVSNTGLIMTTFLLAATIYLKIRKTPSKVEYSLVECVFPACLFVSILLPLILSGKIFDVINRLMNTRLIQSRNYLLKEKITLFGATLGLNNSINTIDNSFLFAFLTYGVVFFVLWSAGYLVTIKRYVILRRKWELAVIVTILIAGVSEPFLFNTSFKNITLLFLGEQLFEVLSGIRYTKKNICVHPTTKQIKIPFFLISIKNLLHLLKRFRVSLLLLSLTMGILWAAFYSFSYEMPDKIYVPRHLCDSVEQESVYLPSEATSDKSVVLGFIDDMTEMVSFSGILVKAEKIRGIVCRFIYGFSLGFIVVLFVCNMLEYNNSGRLRSFSDEKRRKTL